MSVSQSVPGPELKLEAEKTPNETIVHCTGRITSDTATLFQEKNGRERVGEIVSRMETFARTIWSQKQWQGQATLAAEHGSGLHPHGAAAT